MLKLISPAEARQRVLAWVNLKDVVEAQVAVVDAQGDLCAAHRSGEGVVKPCRLLICSD